MDEEIKIKKAKGPLPVRFVSTHETTRGAARKLGQAVSEYIPRTAISISPYQFAARHIFYILLSVPIALAGIPLALMLHWALIFLLLTPLIFLFLPWLRLKSMVGDRKRAAGDELPFFAVHAAIAQSAGLNLYESLCATIGEGIFEQIEKGGSAVKRNVKLLGMGPIRAIEELGREHPHTGMKTLLLGYTSEWRAGGDVASYLEDKAEEFLRRTKHRWRRYREDISKITQIILATLLIMPLVVLMAIFVSASSAFGIGLGFILIGIPLIITFCIALIHISQPKDYTRYSGNLYLPILVFPLVFFAMVSFFSIWIAIGASTGAGFLAYGLPVLIQRRGVLKEEEALPQFLRDMTEYQKLNYPMKKAVETLWREHKYNDQFNELIGHVVKQLKMGRRFSELDIPSRSWLTKLTFFHLGQIAESGGFTTKPMELLTDFITRVKESRDETRSSLRIYRGLAIATPFALVFVVGIMMGVLTSFQMPETMTAAAGMGLPQFGISVPPSFHAISRMIVFLSSVGIGFLMSFASDLTAKNTSWVALNAFLATAAMAILPLIAGWMSGFFAF